MLGWNSITYTYFLFFLVSRDLVLSKTSIMLSVHDKRSLKFGPIQNLHNHDTCQVVLTEPNIKDISECAKCLMDVLWVCCHFSCVWLWTLWTVIHQAPLSMGFSRQEYWNGWPCPSPGDLPNPRIKPESLKSPALAGRFFTTRATWEAHGCFIVLSCSVRPHVQPPRL